MHDDVPHACGFRQRHGCTRNCFGERCQARFERRNVWKTGSEFDSLVCAGLLRPALRVKLFDQTRVDSQHSQLYFVRATLPAQLFIRLVLFNFLWRGGHRQ